MLNLAGLTPIGVRYTPEGPRLKWRVDGQIVETNFDRFRPVQVAREPDSDEIRVTWRDFYDLPMTDPFYHTAQDFATAMPERTGIFQTDLDVAERVVGQSDTLPFSGAVFHMARTGSTLCPHPLIQRDRQGHEPLRGSRDQSSFSPRAAISRGTALRRAKQRHPESSRAAAPP